ncbi:MAG: hypothetical protein KatS3mg008_0144 [Acidimicrobiales bacterium]|nr:MAG: hypothetical protein KatS3mg008_0144 [Acidimicrobiales bacterium]
MYGARTVKDALTGPWLKLVQSVNARWSGGSGSERGANLIEYAFLLALIVIVCLAAVTMLGETTNSELYGKASSAFANAP